LPEPAVAAVQVCTKVGPVLVAVQVVVTQLLPEVAVMLLQEAWAFGVGPEVALLQVVTVLPLVPAVQVWTGTLVVSAFFTQVVLTPPVLLAVQLATVVTAGVEVVQVVVTQLLPEFPVTPAQAVGVVVGPVLLVLQSVLV
jgi:hypothetical protein